MGSGVSVKSKPLMTPSLNFGLGIQAGAGDASPSGLSCTLETRSMTTRTVSLLPMPSWALPVAPNASSADAVTAIREPTLASRMPARNAGSSSLTVSSSAFFSS